MGFQDEANDVLKGKRVVIVEDEGITVMQLRSILNGAGMDVVGAVGNAAEAVDLILKELPDLVLMDINMPGERSGLDAAEAVLKTVRLCIVMLTAYSDEEYMRRAREYGACGYIVKPISRNTLVPNLRAAYAQWIA